ncbi:MAG: type II toxin-antitoxin system HipA family toxin [Nocardioides sp.]|uniref:type II toxin-antitoxin system HipA family toxin n=1 Tax=Nocardioides sp. TaxID=35761 RepID=UPI003D6BBA8F
MRLAVELYGTIVGGLTGQPATYDFVPSAEGIDRFGANSLILSVVAPLVGVSRKHQAARRRNWFAELLPEGDQYDYMLRQAGLRRGDTLGFLARYGRDVAGALQVWDLDDPTEPKTPSRRPVDDAGIRRLLEDPVGSPLANESLLGKSSLAGVQPKVVLVRDDAGWAQSLGGYPTTHIIKPMLERRPSVVFDEEYGARVSRALSLAEHNAWIDDFDGLSALVIERFDRAAGARVHQEDFSQALGASGDQKYQEYGGLVSLRRIADTLQRTTRSSDLVRLARMVVLAVAIGNLDMHAKNLGILHPLDDEPRLAPAYDVVPQSHLSGIDGKMALAVNGSYRHAGLAASDIKAEIAKWGVRRADRIVDDCLAEIAEVVAKETPLPGAHPALQEDIATFTENLREGRLAGRPGSSEVTG